MRALPLGLDRLRVLDAALGGDLYAFLAACRDAGLEPHLFAGPEELSVEGEAELVAHAVDEAGAVTARAAWIVCRSTHPEAYRCALEIRITDLLARSRARVDRAVRRLDGLDEKTDGQGSCGEGP